MQKPDTYLPIAEVRRRYGVSDMTIWRWLADDRLGFPQPMRIRRRRFWKLSALLSWEAQREGANTGGSPCAA